MSFLFKVKFINTNLNAINFIIIILITYINCNYINPCFSVQECQDISATSNEISNTKSTYSSQSTKCSIHGKCFYDYTTFMFQEVKYPFITCVCDNGYITANVNDTVYCCYKQKLQSIAFILETVPGLGAGHFYLGNYILGGIKLTFMLVFIITTIVCTCYLKSLLKNKVIHAKEYKPLSNNPNPTNKTESEFQIPSPAITLNFVSTICVILICIWQCIDSVLFGINFYTDGNNVKVKEW